MEACHGHNKKRISLEVNFWAQGKFSPALIFLVVGVWCFLHTRFRGGEKHRLKVGGEHGRWVCVTPSSMSVKPSCGGCRTWELLCFRVCWTFGHFLCMIMILIHSFRLFIEKLPKHRDYKSAVIPEKKDTVKVGLHFHCCPSKSSTD